MRWAFLFVLFLSLSPADSTAFFKSKFQKYKVGAKERNKVQKVLGFIRNGLIVHKDVDNEDSDDSVATQDSFDEPVAGHIKPNDESYVTDPAVPRLANVERLEGYRLAITFNTAKLEESAKYRFVLHTASELNPWRLEINHGSFEKPHWKPLATTAFSVAALGLELWRSRPVEISQVLLAWMTVLSFRSGHFTSKLREFVSDLLQLLSAQVEADDFKRIEKRDKRMENLETHVGELDAATGDIMDVGKDMVHAFTGKHVRVDPRIGAGLDAAGTAFSGLSTAFFLLRAVVIDKTLLDRAVSVTQAGLVWVDITIHALLAVASGGITVPITLAAGLYSTLRASVTLALEAAESNDIADPFSFLDEDKTEENLYSNRRTEVCFASLYAAASAAEFAARSVHELMENEAMFEVEAENLIKFDNKRARYEARRSNVDELFSDLFLLLVGNAAEVHNIPEHIVEQSTYVPIELKSPDVWRSVIKNLGFKNEVSSDLSIDDLRMELLSQNPKRYTPPSQRSQRSTPYNQFDMVGDNPHLDMVGRIPLQLCGHTVKKIGPWKESKYVLPETMDWNWAVQGVDKDTYDQCRELMRTQFHSEIMADRMPCSPSEYIAAFFYNVKKQGEDWNVAETMLHGFDTTMAIIASPTTTIVGEIKEKYQKAISREKTISGKMFDARDMSMLNLWFTLHLYHSMTAGFYHKRTSERGMTRMDPSDMQVTRGEFKQMKEKLYGDYMLKVETTDSDGGVIYSRPGKDTIFNHLIPNENYLGEDGYIARSQSNDEDIMDEPDEDHALDREVFFTLQVIKTVDERKKQLSVEQVQFEEMFEKLAQLGSS